jgi:hypothetical protein
MADVTQATFLEGPRPDNFMAGVINDQQQMELVVNELRSLGFPEESIAVLHGESGADALRHRGEQPGVTGFFQGILARFREAAGNELENIQQHVEAAERGNYVVAVLLPNTDVELSEKVRQSLKSHGGYNIVLGRRNSLQTLDA